MMFSNLRQEGSKKRDILLKAVAYLRNLCAFPYRKMIFKKIGKKVYISPRSRIVGADKVELGNGVFIDDDVFINADGEGVIIGHGTFVKKGAVIETYGGHIHLGNNSSLNAYCVLYGHGGLNIGSDVRIATSSIIVAANHVFSDVNLPITKQGLSKKGISIADNVWLGAGSKILDGVTVGSGSVIAAGAVVTKDVPNDCVYGGIPAKLIKERN